jgi:CDP-6-deoxy-D-xylo-4-hexulose-3-dehydrase
MKYPLATSTWDQAEINAINRVISSGMCTMGENVMRFEKDFAAFVGARLRCHGKFWFFC